MIEWRGILIHYSASPDRVLDDWRGIVAYHTAPMPRGRGWSRVGYHYGIELEGDKYVVRQGRSVSMPGAHCPTRNQIDLGVCLVGDFTKEAPPAEQLETTADLCAELCERWRILPMDIRPHRAFRKTECPGKAFTDSVLIGLREAVMHRLVSG